MNKNIMNKHLSRLSLIMLCCASTYGYSTVGGGQTIEMLGYEPVDQKVYLLRHYEDARGRLPQLYYYDLNAKNPSTLIEVKSIYINPKTQKIDHDHRWSQVTQSIKNIKQRLIPLIALENTHLNLQVKQQIKRAPAWDNPKKSVKQYHHRYTISAAQTNLRSTAQQAISYTPDLSIQKSYKIPKHAKMITTVKYLAFPEETGYTTEDPVLLLPTSN